jgi:broad specificity phosphatase PhoE
MQNMYDEKTKIKLELVYGIEEINPENAFSILIRHADRNKIPEGEFGNEVELNKLGFKRALEYGTKLSHLKIHTIYTSPIKRCVQTAESIREALKYDIEIEESILLGDPGPFVYDAKKAGASYMELGFKKCYEKLLEDEFVDGNRNTTEGAEILTNFIKEKSKNGGVNIFVSHDMIVALYAYKTFRKKYTLGSNWIKYLDGLILKHNEI